MITLRRLAPLGTLVSAIVLPVAVLASALPASHGNDPYSYWTYRLSDPAVWAYGPNMGVDGVSVSHPYSPAFAQALAPLQALPFPAFVMLWTALAAMLLVILVGPRLAGLAVLLLPPVAHEILNPNVGFMLALVAGVGLRWPALWPVALLTKVTPGIGVLWFAFRREWRSLAIALGLTATIVAVSALADPHAWATWLPWLLANRDAPTYANAVPVPLLVRLPLAAGLLRWGARGDHRWTVALAMWLALPVLWPDELVILLGALAGQRHELEVEVGRRRERALAPEDVHIGGTGGRLRGRVVGG